MSRGAGARIWILDAFALSILSDTARFISTI
jgi:hypothetical protein